MAVWDHFDAVILSADELLAGPEQVVVGAQRTLEQLRMRGCTMRFMTADPRWTRAALAERLANIGFQGVQSAEIVTSSSLTAAVLVREGAHRVYAIGPPALLLELESAGLSMADNRAVDAVVIGCNDHLADGNLHKAINFVAAGAVFIATDSRPLARTAVGGYAPGSGALAAAIEAATRVKPHLIGPPQPDLIDAALRTLAPQSRAVVVAWQPDNAALAARRAGLPVVLIGNPFAETSARGAGHADAIVPTLCSLLTLDPGAWYSHSRQGQLRPTTVEPCVGAVIHDSASRVLWIRRRDNGLWALPTGHVEPGEKWGDAVLREIEEEVGLALSNPILTGLYSDPRFQVIRFPNGHVGHYVTATFRLHAADSALRLDSAEVCDAVYRARAAPPSPRVENHLRWIDDAMRDSAPPVVD